MTPLILIILSVNLFLFLKKKCYRRKTYVNKYILHYINPPPKKLFNGRLEHADVITNATSFIIK